MDRTQLNRATAENPTPPPGYIYSEIAKWTHNNPSVNQNLEKYLVARLKKNNPFVKWKVCLIIKHTAPKANVGFKRAMQRHTDIIKACMQFRGPPHATLGDTPYQNVRAEAKAAVEAIFAETTTQQTQGLKSKITSMGSNGGSNGPQQNQQQHAAFNSSGAGRYQTSSSSSSVSGSSGRYGGSSSSGSGGGGGGGQAQMGAEGSASAGSYRGNAGRAMVGQGNPNFKDPRNKKPGFFDKVGKMVSGKKTGTNSNGSGTRQPGQPSFMNNPTGAQGYNYASNRGPNAVGSSGYGAPSNSTANTSGGRGYASSNNINSPPRRNSGTRKTGGVGGAWGMSSGNDIQLRTNNNGSGGVGGSGSASSSSATSSSGNGTMPSGRAGNAKSDGAYETQLVDNICAPGGLRPRPATADVKRFISRCKTLDAEMMAGLLVDRVCSDDWTVSAKALIVVDELAKDESCAAFADFFYDQKDVFEEEMRDSEQKMVRDRAKKVLVTLGVEGLETQKNSGNNGRRKGRAALPEIPNVDDVLGGSGGSDGGGGVSLSFDANDSSATTSSSSTTPQTINEQDDLLGMFGSSEPGHAVAATPAGAASGGGGGGGGGGLDMFSGLGATTAPTAAAPSSASSSTSGGFDFMNSAPAATPAAPTLAPASMLLPASNTSLMQQPMQPMGATPMQQPSSTSNVMAPVQPITSAFDGLDMNKGSSTRATSSNFAFQQQAQQRARQQQAGNNTSVDPLAGLSGIASSTSSQGGLLGMDFSNGGMNQANQQQKIQQVMAAQQRRPPSGNMGMGMGLGMGAQGQRSMGMQGMGGVRQMQPGANQPLPDFANQGRNTSQPAPQQKKQNASFGFVNDMLS